MPTDPSELRSLADLLEQLTRRITVMAEQCQRDREDSGAKELFAIERALAGAHRRVVRLTGGRS